MGAMTEGEVALGAGAGDGRAGEVYRKRLGENRAALLREQGRDRRFGYAKLAMLAVLFFGAIALLRTPVLLLWLLIPVAIFIALAAVHDRVLQRVLHTSRVLKFYERGLERLNDEWAGSGETGERFLDPAHAYARDLDIFGKGSLFELLCTARTRAGEETLAGWLLEPAGLDVIRARQAAVAELRERVNFREKLFAAGDSVRVGVHPERLAAWGETVPELAPRWLRPVMALLALVLVASGIYWLVSGYWYALLVAMLFNLSVSKVTGRGLGKFVKETEEAAVDLKVLASVLGILEQERFEAPLLVELQAKLRTDGMAPSKAIRKLDRVGQYLEARRNLMMRPFNYAAFYVAQVAFAAESWRRRHGAAIRGWLAVVGEMEALAALSAYAYEHPRAVFAEFGEEAPFLEAAGLAHPLLPEGRAVRNDVRLDGERRLMLISGPNMAGKSTFVRGVGINVVLAQCGATVQAEGLRLSPLAVGASICVLDSLQGGVSRFYAEIQRLKLISDLTRGGAPVLFLLDELLSGTNSHDRLTGTQYLVRALVAQGAVGLITTHDLALTEIAETISGAAVNWHFEDQLQEGKLHFDYKLKPGVVRTSNALKLMQQIGLAVEG
ncbi:MAG: mismatch repair protein [Acidobacteriaceae bacterium]